MNDQQPSVFSVLIGLFNSFRIIAFVLLAIVLGLGTLFSWQDFDLSEDAPPGPPKVVVPLDAAKIQANQAALVALRKDDFSEAASIEAVRVLARAWAHCIGSDIDPCTAKQAIGLPGDADLLAGGTAAQGARFAHPAPARAMGAFGTMSNPAREIAVWDRDGRGWGYRFDGSGFRAFCQAPGGGACAASTIHAAGRRFLAEPGAARALGLSRDEGWDPA